MSKPQRRVPKLGVVASSVPGTLSKDHSASPPTMPAAIVEDSDTSRSAPSTQSSTKLHADIPLSSQAGVACATSQTSPKSSPSFIPASKVSPPLLSLPPSHSSPPSYSLPPSGSPPSSLLLPPSHSSSYYQPPLDSLPPSRSLPPEHPLPPAYPLPPSHFLPKLDSLPLWHSLPPSYSSPPPDPVPLQALASESALRCQIAALQQQLSTVLARTDVQPSDNKTSSGTLSGISTRTEPVCVSHETSTKMHPFQPSVSTAVYKPFERVHTQQLSTHTSETSAHMRPQVYGQMHQPYSAAINPHTGLQVANNTLKKLYDLPEFSGKAEDWPMFYTAFRQTTEYYGYNNFENSQRLQRCLKGEAKETVKCLLIHPDNVNQVIEQLSLQFGRPDQLIRSQLTEIRELQPITEQAMTRLVAFSVKTKNLVSFLQCADAGPHLNNPILVEELVSKLPFTKRVEWARYASAQGPYPSLSDFSAWLTDIARVISVVQEAEQRDTKRRPILHAVESNYSCTVCKEFHRTQDCERFLHCSVKKRWAMIKELRLCFGCLAKGHSVRDCRRRKACPIDDCKKWHHRLLHDSATEIVERPNESILNCHSKLEDNKLSILFRVAPVILYGRNKSVETFALLDEGSSVTLMDTELLKQLGEKGNKQKLNLQWLGGRHAEETATLVNIKISGIKDNIKYSLNNVYAVQNLELPVQSLYESDINQYDFKLPVKSFINIKPKLLIGLDNCHLGLSTETIQIKQNGPYATNTKIGWIVFGPTNSAKAFMSNCLHLHPPEEHTLQEIVEAYFQTESFGVTPSSPIESEADRRAKVLQQTTTQKIGKRYQTGLLWATDNIVMPDSYPLALSRLRGVERKLRKSTDALKAYDGIIRSYVEKGYARKLPLVDVKKRTDRTWFLPHFAVVNPNKPKKLRLVFDAAAKVNGVSLNSCLLKGPQDLKPLPAVLFNFRKGPVAVCADIKEMFHQVLIQPEDRCAQRFLWRNGDANKVPDVYEMNVMIFGAACSPSSAQFVKTLNALEHKNSDSRAIEAILDCHYVDDFVDSFQTAEEAIRIASEVRSIHKDAGFDLVKFISNSPAVIAALHGSSECLNITDKGNFAMEKVLGMFWQPATDSFKYKINLRTVGGDVVDGNRRPTKRELLSIVMSIFDPLGFLCHITIAAKLILRETWRRNINWDEPLPNDISVAWDNFRQDIIRVDEIEIPRQYFNGLSPEYLELHVFVDASEKAFAAVAYWRVTSNGQHNISLISAKTRGAPLKPLTMPRLELQAAVLGTRLRKTILSQHSFVVHNVIMWTDSTTVIKWISSQHRRYRQFVAHRVDEILANTRQVEWRWLPSLENVADEATRGQKVDLGPTSRWLHGPSFLDKENSQWPITDSANMRDESNGTEEMRSEFTMLVAKSNFISFDRFSSLTKLLRTTAYMIRFIQMCRHKDNSTSSIALTVADLKKATKILCRVAQQEVYSIEIHCLNSKQPLPRDSRLRDLTPYLDEDNTLRVYGRIDAANSLTYSAKRPIILPPDHRFTHLVIMHHHCQMRHTNVEATICDIRKLYWIPRLRQAMRKCLATCIVCKLSKTVPRNPIMGQLPEDRLVPFVRPFTYTGLDYFGPVAITIGRRHEKRWVALFTCLTIRAIHLEIANDLSTDGCIMVIRNFINRRGVPKRIRSDNGKNFIGANREIKRFSEVFNCVQLQNELSSKGIEWIFNCPMNPSEGGVWERMVKCVKSVLKHTLKETAPKECTLRSCLLEAENIVNSRPLTHLPVTPDQEEPLTPNHFILGEANPALTPSIQDVDDKPQTLNKQWRIAQQLRNRFWKKWVAEYLPTLTRRTKWCRHEPPLKEGDLVFICDPNTPREQWKRGRIEKLFRGKDGVARRAEVRTCTGVLQRAISRLAFLDLCLSESRMTHGGGSVAECLDTRKDSLSPTDGSHLPGFLHAHLQ